MKLTNDIEFFLIHSVNKNFDPKLLANTIYVAIIIWRKNNYLKKSMNAWVFELNFKLHFLK